MKKILSVLALGLVALTASAVIPTKYALTKAANANGTMTLKVDDAEVTEAAEGATVTVIVAPANGYLTTAVSGRLYTDWGSAKTRGTNLGVDEIFVATKVTGVTNTYTFKMPASAVEVSATFTSTTMDVDTKETENKDKNVDDVTATISPSTDEEPTVENGVLVIPVTVTGVNIPDQADATTTDKKDVTVYISGEIVSTDGKTKMVVTSIAANAFKGSDDSDTRVTTVVLPETAKPIKIADGAMKVDDLLLNVVTPLSMLDDYALMTSLKENYEATKVTATATPKNKYWTFSSGVDCTLPEGIDAFIAIYTGGVIRIVPLSEDDMKLADNRRGIKANNGVLLACTNNKGGDAYTFTASPGNQLSGATIATTDANSFAGNCLVPVIEGMHFDSESYLILKNNEFFHIDPNINTKVPACKAVFSMAKAK